MLALFTFIVFGVINYLDTCISSIIEKSVWLSKSSLNWVITILSTVLNGYFIHNLCNWYRNPTFANNKKQSVNIPDELKELTLEDFIKQNNQ